jgi:hypothetical protein
MLMLNESHCEGELWGLAFNPIDKDRFVTVGGKSRNPSFFFGTLLIYAAFF